MSKYGATRTEAHGRTFSSRKEARRYEELLTLHHAAGVGRVKGLRCQVPYVLKVNGWVVARYVADFVYHELQDDGDWLEITEDVKGVRTPVYRLKARLMFACHGITIRET